MAAVMIPKAQVLFTSDTPASALYLILKGSFSLSFPGGSFTLSKGDVAGICEIGSERHITTCTALEDSSIMAYPISDIPSLENFLKESIDYGVLFLRSAFRQVRSLRQQYDLSLLTCENLYSECIQDYSFYQACCGRHRLKERTLNAISSLQPLSEDIFLEDWAPAYYDGFLQFLSSQQAACLGKTPSVSLGLIASISNDFRQILPTLLNMQNYQKQVLSLYMNGDLEDIYDLYTDTYLKLGVDSPDSEALYKAILRMTDRMKTSDLLEKNACSSRFEDFESCLKTLRPASETDVEESSEVSSEQIQGSLQAILDYSEASPEFCTEFKKLILQYRGMEDRTAGDDASRALFLAISKQFYELYTYIFFKAVDAITIPLPVLMFLYFGYVDEQLAGTANAVHLGHMASMLYTESHEGVYTLYDWLVAIWDGKREPSRNEFDQDYLEYLHSQKISGKIDAAEEVKRSQDMAERVRYELRNMVPVVNRMVFGRLSAFCPVFSSHNAMRSLDVISVNKQTVSTLLDEIEHVDFSAFYREYIYSNTAVSIPNEQFHVKVRPDIILMPQIGTRGVMWQEIEGRKRTSPARMMLPIFHLEDLRTALIRLVGEYRWEMCKRVQGGRWNDVSDRSLTSEYFDYIQFYRKNHDLSADARDRIKSALQKAHNSYKEMFVRDYITYIQFESIASPRLTKPARQILFLYCPFAANLRETLHVNPLYRDMIDSFILRQKQLSHKLDLLEHRVKSAGKPFPPELSAEREYSTL